MSFLTNFIHKNEENSIDLSSQLEDLKAELKVSHLQLRDKELKFAKRAEEYESHISKIADDNKNLKDKYEKIYEAQRKLEKQNSNLEDRLLKIVEKYEAEQKTLLEELTIAHSKLVEAKLTIAEVEREKESYRQDCNIAVNLLQCKPTDFIHHSYSSLPVNLKDRLKSLLSVEEILKLEDAADNTPEFEYQKQKSNSLLKIPIFQPTAAAAMMFNIQSASLQREKQKQQRVEDAATASDPLMAINRSLSQSALSNFNSYTSIPMGDEPPVGTPNKSSLSGSTRSMELIDGDGKVSSALIAQVLKKESARPSKKSYKLFPYICLRCKKEMISCDTSSQTSTADLEGLEAASKVMYPRPVVPELFSRSKTVAIGLSDMTNSHYRDAEPDLSPKTSFKMTRSANEGGINENRTASGGLFSQILDL